MTNSMVFLMHQVLGRNIWGAAGLLRENECVVLVSHFVISRGKQRPGEEEGLIMLDWASVKHLEEFWLCYERLSCLLQPG